ncbi:hypothetical protein PB01_07830 [Psychrobacillus glaciei]|uniref:DUF7852 domain-containing protein n=1 Tax=Psychrobacillus glaciei TaxID=2283160 RepID=A0A5J6SLK3_9BACI|nr:hypothetical protein PB01_07830 [Psychrobacillus glaciei]
MEAVVEQGAVSEIGKIVKLENIEESGTTDVSFDDRININLESIHVNEVPLNPPASEIKRVFKGVFLTQCKLVPVQFGVETCPGVREVTRDKLFLEGFIRKDIEYTTTNCNGFIRDRIATVPFSGFAELTANDFLLFPTLGGSSESRSRFI